MRDYKRLVLRRNSNIKPGDVILLVLQHAKSVNIERHIHKTVIPTLEVAEDRIKVFFTWDKDSTDADNRLMQKEIYGFVTDDFQKDINRLLNGVSNWSEVRIRRTCRRIDHKYWCEIISV